MAANYAYYDACVDHSDEGIYAAVFTAAVQSAAFFESDTQELIDIGLSYIPEHSAIHGVAKLIRECYAGGDDWKTARKKLLIAYPSSFGEMDGEWKGTAAVPACDRCPVQVKDEEIPQAEHGYDAPASIGIILLGWLYGEGDFAKSVCLAVNCGEDTDCTAGTLGSILGIIAGKSGLPEKWVSACSDKIATCTLRTDNILNVPTTMEEFCLRVVRQAPVVLRETCRFSEDGIFTIEPVANLFYDGKQFKPYLQEDFKTLLDGQGNTVRIHFRTLTVSVRYDDTLAKISEGVEKVLHLTFENRLYVPQYLTVRLIDCPEEWEFGSGREFCVGLEHWHGGYNDNHVEMCIIPRSVKRGKYTLVMEISANSRGEKMYLPLTFINGAC